MDNSAIVLDIMFVHNRTARFWLDVAGKLKTDNERFLRSMIPPPPDKLSGVGKLLWLFRKYEGGSYTYPRFERGTLQQLLKMVPRNEYQPSRALGFFQRSM